MKKILKPFQICRFQAILSLECLRNGMSCRAEILVDRYEDAISVPIQAVTRVAGQPMVLEVQRNRAEFVTYGGARVIDPDNLMLVARRPGR